MNRYRIIWDAYSSSSVYGRPARGAIPPASPVSTAPANPPTNPTRPEYVEADSFEYKDGGGSSGYIFLNFIRDGQVYLSINGIAQAIYNDGPVTPVTQQ
jgi:hypothetical protein